jgi:tRNA dimethylallyltransferase
MVSPNLSLPPIVILVGATGTGKSGLAMEWARRWPVEIVNIDASQVYREMTIGTAKPTAMEQAEVPHHLYDIVDPDDPLDAGRYLSYAQPAVAGILARQRLPLFVGGTGLYVKALLHGLAEIPDIPDSVRHAVQGELARVGPVALHEELAQVDAAAAERINPNDPQRTTRALEVFRHTGVPISDFQKRHRFAPSRYNALVLCLDIPREAHRPILARRVDGMFKAGFVQEVKQLLEAGWDPDLRSFKALGYRAVMDYLAGRISLRMAREKVLSHHSQYAKRQRTWFRRMDHVHWFLPSGRGEAEQLIGPFIEGALA